MELVAGYPYWLLKTGLPYQYPTLLEDKSTRVLIIGGGISGALAAYYCVEAGIECILVDSRTIALGSTCASTSLLQYELDTPLHQLKKLVGENAAVRSYQLCGEAVDKLIALMDRLGVSEYTRRESLFFSSHKKEKEELNKEYLARRDAGFEVQMLDKRQMSDEYGLEAEYGILSAKGASTNAYSLTHKILQYCIQKGLQVFDSTEIKSIEYKGKKIQVKTGQGHRISPEFIINASGYEVVNFIGKKIVNLDCTYALVSQANDRQTEALKKDAIFWNTDNPYLYICPTADNRMMIGGRDEAFVNMKTMHRYLSKKARLLKKDFENCFPSKKFRTEFEWSGIFGKTRDSLPYIGTYGKTPGIFYALGFGGNGITFSLIAAEIIADILSGRKNENAELFSFSR